MLKRTITGGCYALTLCGFFLLREFVDYRLFAILIFLFCSIGTFEIARAEKTNLIKGNFIAIIVYGGLLVPLYCGLQHFLNVGYLVVALPILLGLLNLAICLFLKKSRYVVATNILCYFYPAIFIISMLLANDLGQNKGFIALLLPFVVSALSDTFAYFTGSLIGGKKLCPKLSPKKTWSGAIGGTVGGAVGSLIVYFIFQNKVSVNFVSPIILFIIFGIVASVLTIVGDLFESFIKRKAGIKDMGNILPGHGGVLDRIDGTSFVCLLSYIVFLLV